MNRWGLRRLKPQPPSQDGEKRRGKRCREEGDEARMQRKAVLRNQGQGVKMERWKSGKEIAGKIIKRRGREGYEGRGGDRDSERRAKTRRT